MLRILLRQFATSTLCYLSLCSICCKTIWLSLQYVDEEITKSNSALIACSILNAIVAAMNSSHGIVTVLIGIIRDLAIMNEQCTLPSCLTDRKYDTAP